MTIDGRGTVGIGIGYLEDANFITSRIDDSNEGAWIHAKLVRPTDWRCPACGKKASKHGVCYQLFVDVPYQGRPAKLRVEIPRGRCLSENCETNTFQFRPDGYFDGKLTSRCRRYIEDNCFKQTFSALAKQTGVPEATIRRIADNLLDKLNNNFRIDTPRILSIDEVCLPSGKDEKVKAENTGNYPNGKTKIFRTILSDGETSQVIDVLPNKEGFTVYQSLVALQGYERIQFVTIDLSPAFRNAVRAAYGDRVTIVADRWHVAKRINSVVDKARRNVRKDQKKTAKDLRLCLTTRSRVLKKKNREMYQDLVHFLECTPHLKSVYWAKEKLLDVYQSGNREEAEARFEEWIDSLDDQVSNAFSGVVQTFSNWREEIFSYWDCMEAGQDNDAVTSLDADSPINDYLKPDVDNERYTNARAEARNRQIRHLNGAGRSYSFRFLRARSIFSTFEVWRQFSICFECRTAFRRDMNSPGRRIEKAVDAHAADVKFNPATFCRSCEPSSTGVTRSDGKPVQPFVTRCGLTDVWTEREPAIKDETEWLAQSEGRRRRLKLFPEKASA